MRSGEVWRHGSDSGIREACQLTRLSASMRLRNIEHSVRRFLRRQKHSARATEKSHLASQSVSPKSRAVREFPKSGRRQSTMNATWGGCPSSCRHTPFEFGRTLQVGAEYQARIRNNSGQGATLSPRESRKLSWKMPWGGNTNRSRICRSLRPFGYVACVSKRKILGCEGSSRVKWKLATLLLKKANGNPV